MVAAEPGQKAALLEKLHTLCGVLPLGAFVVLHLLITSAVVGSREVYDAQIGRVHGGPAQLVFEVVFVLGPFAYHAGYGVWRMLSRAEPTEDHGYQTDLMRSLQRVAGVVVLVFVALHVWEFRVQTWMTGLEVGSYSTKLVEHLSTTHYGVPFIALGYVIGIAATGFHVANGLTSFCVTWGYVKTPRAALRARLLFRALGIFVFVVGTAMVLQLASGARFFPKDGPKDPLLCGSAVPPPTSTLPAPPP